MIHTSYGDGENLCDADTYPWPERCMDDSFARTLPVCPDCVEIASERRNGMPDLTAGIIPMSSPPVLAKTGVTFDHPPKRHGPIYLIDFLKTCFDCGSSNLDDVGASAGGLICLDCVAREDE